LGIGQIPVAKIQDLCEEYFANEWIARLATLHEKHAERRNFLGAVRKMKRSPILLLIGLVTVAIASAGIISYVIMDRKVNNLHDEVGAVERDLVLARESIVAANSAQAILINEVEQLLNMSIKLKSSLEILANVTPDIAWQATRLYLEIRDSAEAIDKIIDSLDQDILNIPAFMKLVDYSGKLNSSALRAIKSLKSYDTDLKEINRLSNDTIEFVFTGETESNTTSVYRVSSFNIFAATDSGASRFVRYAGPKYLIHNKELNCTQSIDDPDGEATFVAEECNQENYIDPKLSHWTPLENDDTTYPLPQVKKSKGYFYVYCMYHDIKLGSDDWKPCPSFPMRISAMQSFSLINFNHTTRTVNLDARSFVPAIKPSYLNTTFTDSVYRHWMEDIKKARKSNIEGLELAKMIGNRLHKIDWTIMLIGCAGCSLLSGIIAYFCINSKKGLDSAVHDRQDQQTGSRQFGEVTMAAQQSQSLQPGVPNPPARICQIPSGSWPEPEYISIE